MQADIISMGMGYSQFMILKNLTKVISHLRFPPDRTANQLQRFRRKRKHIRLAISPQSRLDLTRHRSVLSGHS
jgi:hypothetical protein